MGRMKWKYVEFYIWGSYTTGTFLQTLQSCQVIYSHFHLPTLFSSMEFDRNARLLQHKHLILENGNW